MSQRKLLLRALAVALLFGLIFWLVDSLAYLHYFGQNLRRMMFAPPETLLDALFLSISAHTLFVRISFLITCLIGGWLAAHYMNRQRKSEERLRQVVENMPVMMDAFDEDYNLMAWNRECERVTGYRAAELVGAPLPLERLYPDADYRERMIAEQTRLGSDFRGKEWTLIARNGTPKTISWSNISARVPVPGWDTWAIGVDVTERVQAQHRITHLNAVLRAIRNVNQLIVREKDPITLIDRACHLLTETRGYQHAWIALVDQRRIVTAMVSAGLDRGFEAVREHFRQDEQIACVQHVLAQSGVHCIQSPVSECPDCPLAAFYQGSSAATIRLEHEGMMYGVLSVALPASYLNDEEERALFAEVAGDISLALHGIRQAELRQATEEALRESEEKFRLLFENAAVLVSVYNRDGVCLLMNKNVAAYFGGTPEDFIGKSFYELHPQQGEPYVKRIRDAIDSPREYAYEDKVVFPQGTRWLLSTVHPVRDAKGTIYAAQIISQDITERKQAEKALREYSETLEEMVAERTRKLQATQEKLLRQERLAALGQLAGSVGHELRTPLTTISNAVYYLKMVLTTADEAPHQAAARQDAAGQQNATIREYLEIIESQVRKGEKILTDLLDFSRVKSLERQEIQVTDVVDLVLDKHVPPDNIQVVMEIPDDLPTIIADPTHFDQVLSNLAVNAYQAMPRGGTLTISAFVRERQVAIVLKDTGAGIAPEHLDAIFEPLFTTKAKGIGLGLAVSKNLTEANGGTITVDSQEGHGSTFTVMLPQRLCEETPEAR